MKDPFAKARDRELARWPDATATVDRGHKHIIIRLAWRGRKALVTCSKSASCPRAVLNHIGDIRRALRGMGAQPA
jgi:hypothetical protein